MAQIPTVELVSGFLSVQFPYSAQAVAELKKIGYARWFPSAKAWTLPHSQDNLDALKRLFPAIVFGPTLSGENKVEEENLLEAELRKYLPKNRDLRITDFTFKTPPLLHQKITFNFARALDQSALLLEMGTGKTKILIDLCTWRHRQKQVRRVLVVAPNSVVPQWLTPDITQHLHDDFNKVTILEGGTKERIKIIEEVLEEDAPGFVVVNYEALQGLRDYLLAVQKGGKKLFDMICLDESSKIKHATSARSKVSWKIGKTCRYRVIMTGLPISQNACDIFSQYRFLDDRIFGAYSTAFRGTYCLLGGFEKREIIGYRNIGALFSKIFSIGIRFEKKSCLDLPDKIYTKRYARLDDAASRKYADMEKKCVVELDGKTITAAFALSRITKLAQLANGFCYETDESGERVSVHEFKKNAKIKVLEEILDEVLPAKLIVWAHFTHEISMITAMLKARGVKFAAIHGAVPQAERGDQVRSFQEDPNCQVFIGQVAAAGLGITLTAASHVVFFSNDFSLENRIQAEDRAHRVGQTRAVTYVDLIATLANGRQTVDHDVLEVLKTKNAFAEEVSRAIMMRMLGRIT